MATWYIITRSDCEIKSEYVSCVRCHAAQSKVPNFSLQEAVQRHSIVESLTL